MITKTSRYASGRIVPQADEKVIVRRRFPRQPDNAVYYTWSVTDRLDLVAAEKLGSPLLWWQIIDANPLIQNPSDIRPGMQIRIPSA